MSLTHTKPTFKEVRLRYNPHTLTFENNMKWYEKTWLGIFTKPESPEKSSNVGEKHLENVCMHLTIYLYVFHLTSITGNIKQR